MMVVTKQGTVAEDGWHLVADDEAAGALAIVSVARWNAERDALTDGGTQAGVVLRSHESADAIAEPHRAALIAIDFPAFTDGRGYSSARTLRTQIGYAGEMRAVGDVTREQIFYMRRCGVDSFAVKAGKPVGKAAAALADFTLSYQAAADDERPLFRRVRR